MADARLPERLQDICQQQDVGATVQVAVVSQGPTPKGRPDLLRMGVVLVTDMRIRQGLCTPHCRLGCPIETGP